MNENKVQEAPEQKQEEKEQHKSAPTSAARDWRKKHERLKQEMEALRRDLQEAKTQMEQLRDKWMRAVAELDNFKKRSARDQEELLRHAQEKVFREFLPILDNLQRALVHANNTQSKEGLLEGIQMIERQFISALERLGVTPMEVLHQAFDPARHEALMQVESEEHEPNTVVQELEKGYLWKERLLRPAKVAVSKRKPV